MFKSLWSSLVLNRVEYTYFTCPTAMYGPKQEGVTQTHTGHRESLRITPMGINTHMLGVRGRVRHGDQSVGSLQESIHQSINI